MKIFVFDTETTGFINKKELNLDNQPHIIQLAGIYGEIINGEFKEIKRINEFVKPPIPIPFGASQVHHIYDVDIKDSQKIDTQIEEFVSYINNSDYAIGHNIEYDESMIKLELKRLGKDYLYKPKNIYCTMKETTDYCQLKGNSERYKYPKLGELYKKLFGEYFLGAHDAIVDVEATLKCFIELYKKDMVNKSFKKEEIMSLF